jgi:hypothetical protein
MKYLAKVFVFVGVLFAGNVWSQTQEQIEEARGKPTVFDCTRR